MYKSTNRSANWVYPAFPANRERDMQDAFICDAVRTPVGRYGGALAPVRADDLAGLT